MKYRIVILLLLLSNLLRAQQNITISYDKNIKDYTPIIMDAYGKLIIAGGGNLYFTYGQYPLLDGVSFHEENKKIKIAIVGLKSKKGQLPTFYDTNKLKAPHSFFVFQGNISVANLSFSVSNIIIKGNNQPYSANHPFVNKTSYAQAIAAINTNTGTVENVTIQDFYGDGIFFAQGMAVNDRRFRVTQPVVRNCKIVNTWGWGPTDVNKDGIMMWQVDRPIIENNQIINDINITKHMGRCGIVLEHNSEGAIIRNNKIEGYDRNIHLECDFGGHLIEKNEIAQSNNGITLSYDCGQQDINKNMYSPTRILNNTFRYNGEATMTPIKQNDFGFISIHKQSFVLDNLTIKGNTFVTSEKTPKLIRDNAGIRGKKQYINLNNQNKALLENNVFK